MPSWFTPIPRPITRPLSIVVLIGWAAVMAVLVNRSYLHASANLATDLARYGSSAQWRGVYYRGEKLGFTVSQTIPIIDDNPANAGFQPVELFLGVGSHLGIFFVHQDGLAFRDASLQVLELPIFLDDGRDLAVRLGRLLVLGRVAGNLR